MKHQTKLLFHPAFMRQYTFQRWKHATKFSNQMFDFTDLVLKLKMHSAFRFWKKYTQDTAPTVTGLLMEIGKNAVTSKIKVSTSTTVAAAAMKFKTQSSKSKMASLVNSNNNTNNNTNNTFPPIAPANTSLTTSKKGLANLTDTLLKARPQPIIQGGNNNSGNESNNNITSKQPGLVVNTS